MPVKDLQQSTLSPTFYMFLNKELAQPSPSPLTTRPVDAFRSPRACGHGRITLLSYLVFQLDYSSRCSYASNCYFTSPLSSTMVALGNISGIEIPRPASAFDSGIVSPVVPVKEPESERPDALMGRRWLLRVPQKQSQ